ncbi:MAG: ECF transporter S component [Christensenellales bacterium]
MQESANKVSRAVRLSQGLAVGCSALAMLLWAFLFRDAYYILCIILLLCAMIPFFLSFERNKPTAAELAVLAVLTALAVAGRAAFFMLPQIKPMAALVIVTGISMGKRDGFMVGAMAAFVSNFLFGQGIWTPFQMFALGLTGYIAGWFFGEREMEPARWMLSSFGFVIVFFVYGMIADLSSVLFLTGGKTLSGILAVYIAGIPFNLIHGATTSVFLFLFGKPFFETLQRLQRKYQFLQEKGLKNVE